MSKRQKLGTCKTCKLALSHSLTLDMLNNFCFHLYAQKSLSHSHTLSISHSLTLDMMNNFCFHVYAQNLLSHFLTLTLSHSHTLSISHSITLDMLNKFCFHLYAQKSLLIAENCNGFFLTAAAPPAPSPVSLEFIELVPS